MKGVSGVDESFAGPTAATISCGPKFIIFKIELKPTMEPTEEQRFKKTLQGLLQRRAQSTRPICPALYPLQTESVYGC